MLLTLFLASCDGLRARALQLQAQPDRCSGSSSPPTCCRRRRCSSRIYRAYRAIPLPDWLSDSGTLLNSYLGLILINTAFQIGFCTFVLSNYMKALPQELYESAEVDGASMWRQYWQITMPLCRPALAALATLQVTWIYNEFFWATVLLQSGDKFPVTSSLNNLKGQFFVDYNLLSAGSVLVALPPIIVFFVLQKQFVSGLTLGATKG